MRRVLVAMSGGVDSSVAAYLLKKEGYDCAGAMMRLFDTEAGWSDNDARAAALKLGVPFFVFDFSREFRGCVIQSFADEYAGGRTPNPCVECNRSIKFGSFLAGAKGRGYEFIASGHYARTKYEAGRYLLKKGLDAEKDQSYVLYAMKQDQLEHTLFPLGELTKPQVRAIAENAGFPNAGKEESQDICFIPDGDYAAFIERLSGRPCAEGPIVDTEGRLLGKHRGALRFTPGQRRGIGVSTSGPPLYVCATDIKTNTVVLGTEDKLYAKSLAAHNINLIACDRIDRPLKVKAKIRYRMPEQSAVVEQTGDDTLSLSFDAAQRAITPGQALVLYDGDIVIGGGTITGQATNPKCISL